MDHFQDVLSFYLLHCDLLVHEREKTLSYTCKAYWLCVQRCHSQRRWGQKRFMSKIDVASDRNHCLICFTAFSPVSQKKGCFFLHSATSLEKWQRAIYLRNNHNCHKSRLVRLTNSRTSFQITHRKANLQIWILFCFLVSHENLFDGMQYSRGNFKPVSRKRNILTHPFEHPKMKNNLEEPKNNCLGYLNCLRKKKKNPLRVFISEIMQETKTIMWKSIL